MKSICIAIILAFFSSLWGLTPSDIAGVWKSPSRLIYFGSGGGGDSEDFDMAYALYYGWYYDDGVTSDSSNIEAVKKNAASSRFPQEFNLTFKQLQDGDTYLNAYEILLHDKNSAHSMGDNIIKTPIVAVGDELYSTFYIKKALDGDTFYECVNGSRDILINGRLDCKNIYSYYTHKDDTYKIRYWETSMDREAFSGDGEQYVTFTAGKGVFRVPKFIESCGVRYTCTTGRRKRVRNVEKCESPNFNKVDKTGRIAVYGNSIATRCTGAAKSDYLSIIAKQNAMKKSPPPPLFIDENDDSYYTKLIDDDISALQKDIEQLYSDISSLK